MVYSLMAAVCFLLSIVLSSTIFGMTYERTVDCAKFCAYLVLAGAACKHLHEIAANTRSTNNQ